ncbi:MAG TPA: hypothetical protein VGZ51_00075, partial [Actinomycetota bacterium]|nr:hypothetical protein [Actinomycetota bacterium]
TLPTWSGDPVLDGTLPIRAESLAELARDRAALGARWLTSVTRDDGSLFYLYAPASDEYEAEDYNEVRHAGTTYALFTAYGVTKDKSVLDAAEGGARYIDENSRAVAGRPGRAFLYEGRTKLGGQALALVALLERRRVLGDTVLDPLIQDLADFMIAMELPEEPGRYQQHYLSESDAMLLEPAVHFYPGEALLALTRLAQQFPDGPYLEQATRAARYLIYEKDGDIPAAGEVPRKDHWLTLALCELYRLDTRTEYRDVAYLQAERMVANQYTAAQVPMRIGATGDEGLVSYTSTATTGELLVSAWGLARFAGDAGREERFAQAAHRTLQFLMRIQMTEENTQLFPRPEAAIGGWGRNALEPWIRIDFVQHSMSALLGMWAMVTTGDLPVAVPQR